MFYMERIPKNTFKIWENGYEICWAPAQSEPPLNHQLCLNHLKKTVPSPLPLLFLELSFHAIVCYEEGGCAV